MNRKAFLKAVWGKGIKPLLWIGAIYFCVKFSINVYAESGAERALVILVLGVTILLIMAHVLGLIFKSALAKINSKLSPSTKRWLRILGKLTDYVVSILLGMLIYHFWGVDWILATVVLAVVLLQRIATIVKGDKLGTTS